MERVQYNGPDDQVNFEVAAATGGPITLEHGHVYEVNADLAERLVSSSQHFERVGEPSLPELRKQAAELGVENADKLGKQAVKAAIAEAKAAAGAEDDAPAESNAGDAAADSNGDDAAGDSAGINDGEVNHDA